MQITQQPNTIKTRFKLHSNLCNKYFHYEKSDLVGSTSLFSPCICTTILLVQWEKMKKKVIKSESYHCSNAIVNFLTLGTYLERKKKIPLTPQNGTDDQNLGFWLTDYHKMVHFVAKPKGTCTLVMTECTFDSVPQTGDSASCYFHVRDHNS